MIDSSDKSNNDTNNINDGNVIRFRYQQLKTLSEFQIVSSVLLSIHVINCIIRITIFFKLLLSNGNVRITWITNGNKLNYLKHNHKHMLIIAKHNKQENNCTNTFHTHNKQNNNSTIAAQTH